MAKAAQAAQAYDDLAGWFEFLNDDCDYPGWSQYFMEGLSRLGAGKKGLELGCGSGAFCRALSRAGYTMTGADVSCAMLNEAERRAAEEGARVQFVLADAAALKTPEKYDFILSPNDCINYLPPRKLHAAFLHIAKCLVRGGIFWFDVSSEYKLRTKVANNMFCDDRDDVTYLEQNRLCPDRVETDVTLFVREGALFRRCDEKHTRYIHSEAALVSAMEGTGLQILSLEGHLGESKEGSDRLNVICKKAQTVSINR